MVPTQEMKEARGRASMVTSSSSGRSLSCCLFPGGRDAHNDVTERIPGELGEVSLTHRKGEHVGWLVFVTIELVQFVDALVVR